VSGNTSWQTRSDCCLNIDILGPAPMQHLCFFDVLEWRLLMRPSLSEGHGGIGGAGPQPHLRKILRASWRSGAKGNALQASSVEKVPFRCVRQVLSVRKSDVLQALGHFERSKAIEGLEAPEQRRRPERQSLPCPNLFPKPTYGNRHLYGHTPRKNHR
jgi:hypothetical protein